MAVFSTVELNVAIVIVNENQNWLPLPDVPAHDRSTIVLEGVAGDIDHPANLRPSLMAAIEKKGWIIISYDPSGDLAAAARPANITLSYFASFGFAWLMRHSALYSILIALRRVASDPRR